LKELIVIEETYWMQTLVYLSAGCIDFLWRSLDTVVKQMRPLCICVIQSHLVAPLFTFKTVSGFLHPENIFSCNSPVFALLRKFKQPRQLLLNITQPSLTQEYLLRILSYLLPWPVRYCRLTFEHCHICPVSTWTGQNFEVNLKK